MLLRHVPSHVIGSWPKGESNILEGLRLALGLGEEQGSRMLGATGKLVVLRTVSAFISSALQDDEDKDTLAFFNDWIADGRGRKKGKAKERAVGRPETVEDVVQEGYLAGMVNWGLDTGRVEEWELGHLGGLDTQAGNETSLEDILAVKSQCAFAGVKS